MWQEGLGKLIKIICLVGSRTRDLPVYTTEIHGGWDILETYVHKDGIVARI
jgi:hypothetical protein